MTAESLDLLKWANKTPAVVSLLYDLNMLPEQLKEGTPEWSKMMLIIAHFNRAIKGEV